MTTEKIAYQCVRCLNLFYEVESLQDHVCNAVDKSTDEVIISETRMFKNKERLWSHGMVLCFLTAYTENKEKFNNVDYTQKHIFEIIAETMRRKGYSDVTWDKCVEKWKTMKRTYRRIVERRRISGNVNFTFPYYNEMEAILGSSQSAPSHRNKDSLMKKINALKSLYRKEVRKSNNLKQSGLTSDSHSEHLSKHGLLEDNFATNQNSEIMNGYEETKAPTIVSLNQNCKSSPSFELDEDSDLVLKWQPSTNFSKVLNAEKSFIPNESFLPSAENIDQMFGHFVISIMKSIPESKGKDDIRMKIIQDLFNFKNS